MFDVNNRYYRFRRRERGMAGLGALGLVMLGTLLFYGVAGFVLDSSSRVPDVQLNLSPSTPASTAKALSALAREEIRVEKLGRETNLLPPTRNVIVGEARALQNSLWLEFGKVAENARNNIVQRICDAGGDPAGLAPFYRKAGIPHGGLSCRHDKPAVQLDTLEIQGDLRALEMLVSPIRTNLDARPWNHLRDALTASEMARMTNNTAYATWYRGFERKAAERLRRVAGLENFARVLARADEIRQAEVHARRDKPFGMDQ